MSASLHITRKLTNPENYLSHHLSAISMAAVYADACHIDDGVTGLKQDAHAAGSSDEE